MLTYHFKMYHNSTLEPVDVLINAEEGFYFTSINGRFIGTFIIDESNELGYSTQDEDLQEYLEGVTMHLRDHIAKHQLAEKLMNRYGQNLISFQYTNDDVLELIAHPDVDIEEFGNVVKDLIYDDVTFESKLSVVISKENNEYTFDFDIN